MTKNIILLFTFILLSCTQTAQKSTTSNKIILQKKENADSTIDSTEIAKILSQKTINRLVYFDQDTFSIPFNYSLKANNRGELLFLWQLGDLEINSKSDNYFSFGFEDQIKFKNDNLSGGNVHIVRTDDKNAVNLAKVKNQLDDIDQIYYSDNESLIFRRKGIINTIYFKYLNDKKAFAVYVSFNDYLWFSKFQDVTEKQKLQLAIEQLSFAKQFFKVKKKNIATSWEEYEQQLNDLNLITIKESYDEITTAVKSSSSNNFIQLKQMDISVMNLKTDHAAIWNEIQKFYSKKEINVDENTFQNFKNIFGNNTVDKIEYMDANTIILLLKSPFDRPFYATIVKTEIKGKQVILATKNIESWIHGKDTSKEMAYFYRYLFHHFGKL